MKITIVLFLLLPFSVYGGVHKGSSGIWCIDPASSSYCFPIGVEARSIASDGSVSFRYYENDSEYGIYLSKKDSPDYLLYLPEKKRLLIELMIKERYTLYEVDAVDFGFNFYYAEFFVEEYIIVVSGPKRAVVERLVAEVINK